MELNDLNEKQREYVSNGCGGKDSRFPVPDLIFSDLCDQHDLDYWVGGDEKARKKVDRKFYKRMARKAWIDPGMQFAAFTFYRAVRRFGHEYFYYGAERVIDELNLEMEKVNG